MVTLNIAVLGIDNSMIGPVVVVVVSGSKIARSIFSKSSL